MISAVAARKAALAQAQAQAQANGAGDDDVAMTEAPESGPSSSSSSKRKSQSLSSDAEKHQTPSSSRSKKKAKTRQQEVDEEGDEQLGGPSKTKRQGKKKGLTKTPKPASKSQRYFTTPQQDSFKQGEDVIALGSGSESDSDSLIVGMEDVEEDDAALSSEGLSDDDLMQIDESLTLSTLFPHTQNAQAKPPQTTATPLSTFQPVVGENVFPLSEDESSNLSLGNLPSSTVVFLPAHDTLCLLGTGSITLLHGSITMLGTTLHASPEAHRIFAPKSSPLPVVRCAFTSSKSSSLSLLPQLSLPSRIEVDEDIKRHGAVLLFSKLRTGVEGLGRICRPFLNVFEPPKWQQHSENGALGIRGLSVVYDQLSDTHPFVLPPSWSEALNRSISANSPSTRNGASSETGNVHLVKGPKNSGKSTFAKTLANRLLEVYTRVAYLDLDPGQPEFTPPGLISLSLLSKPVFGPPWTHPSPPHPSSTSFSEDARTRTNSVDSPVILKSVYLGSTTAKNEVELWLEGSRALWERYREGVRFGVESSSSGYSRFGGAYGDEVEDEVDGNQEDEDEEQEMVDGDQETKRREKSRNRRISNVVPLVINTMGWTKGLGADLTQRIEEEFGVSDVFAFSSPHQHQDESEPVHHRHHHGLGAYSHGFSADEYPTSPIAGGKSVRVYDLRSPISSIPEGPGGRGGGGGPRSGAADQRSMSLLSYFHSVFPSIPSFLSSSQRTGNPDAAQQHSWSTTLPLVAMRPYNLSLAEAGIKKVVLCGAGSEDVVEEEVGRVLCGAVVGLVALDDDAEDTNDGLYENEIEDEDNENPGGEREQGTGRRRRVRGGTLLYTQGHHPPSPYTSTCIGLGIVRGVHPRHIDPTPDSGEGGREDANDRVDLQLLTPVPPALLQKTRVLVKGEMELPIWGWLDFRTFESDAGGATGADGEAETGGGVVEMDQTKTPYLQWGKLGDTRQKGGEKRRVRRNVLRRGLM